MLAFFIVTSLLGLQTSVIWLAGITLSSWYLLGGLRIDWQLWAWFKKKNFFSDSSWFHLTSYVYRFLIETFFFNISVYISLVSKNIKCWHLKGDKIFKTLLYSFPNWSGSLLQPPLCIWLRISQGTLYSLCFFMLRKIKFSSYEIYSIVARRLCQMIHQTMFYIFLSLYVSLRIFKV
jgi:hypothetical protein